MSKIHATAIVDNGALIGPDCSIWHWTHVSSGARIGQSCTIGQNVYVGDGVIVGAECKIQNNVSLFDGVILDNGVFVGPSAVFTNVINPRAFIEKKTEFKKTKVGVGATIGANATILCGISIGEYAMVAAGAVVTKDVEKYCLVEGVPARHVGSVDKHGNVTRF